MSPAKAQYKIFRSQKGNIERLNALAIILLFAKQLTPWFCFS